MTRRKGMKQARVISVNPDRVFVQTVHSGETVCIINAPADLRREGAKCWLGFRDHIPFVEAWDS